MPYVTHVSINLCQYHIENIGGYFYLQKMKLQNQNQVRGASDPEKLFANSNTERKKRVQSSNQAVQFPDSFLYFRIQQPRNSFILWERGELGHSNKSAKCQLSSGTKQSVTHSVDDEHWTQHPRRFQSAQIQHISRAFTRRRFVIFWKVTEQSQKKSSRTCK